MDTTPAFPLSESGSNDLVQRLADFAAALYKASVASPVPLDWEVLTDAIAEIERLRELTSSAITITSSTDEVIGVIEGKDAENIIQIATQSYVLDAVRMALNSPPDG